MKLTRSELKRENKRLKHELAELRSTIAWLLWSISEPIPNEEKPWPDGLGTEKCTTSTL